jgi:hypothetical protein
MSAILQNFSRAPPKKKSTELWRVGGRVSMARRIHHQKKKKKKKKKQFRRNAI